MKHENFFDAGRAAHTQYAAASPRRLPYGRPKQLAMIALIVARCKEIKHFKLHKVFDLLAHIAQIEGESCE